VIFYLDTSFLVPIVVDEAGSESARRWWRNSDSDSVVADLARLEFSAVVSRWMRMGSVTERDARSFLADFDLLCASCLTHTHGSADIHSAERLLRNFSTKLAAPDALHLASALNLGATLVTFDERLAEAARMANASVAAI
jgi:uncharacterized protein